MSTETLERDLAQYLEHSGYEVTFRHAHYHGFFDCYVIYEARIIAERHYRGARYRAAARWAKKRIRDHQAAVRELGGLVR